jgi:hypothetical protein
MHALLLKWKLNDSGLLDALRDYLAEEARGKYETKPGLFQKVWLSRPSEFAAFYLWETEQACEGEIRRMHRVRELTGSEALIEHWQVEAAQEGGTTERFTEVGTWKGGASPSVAPAPADMENPKRYPRDNADKRPEDWISGDEPMTGAQASYLKTLSEWAHEPSTFRENLTKAQASKLIDRLREKVGLGEPDE